MSVARTSAFSWYGVYEGGGDYDRVIDAEVEFLHRSAQVPAR